jgi:hypothetical protein
VVEEDERKLRWKGRKRTNGEEDIANVHRYENGITDPSPVEDVGSAHEDDSNDVVGEHLVVILSSLFEVEDDDLLYPDYEKGRGSV